MAYVELLTVERVFPVDGIGLTVVPDFVVPEGGWKNATLPVRIAKPNGEQIDANANFTLWHFNVLNPAFPKDRRLRVVMSLIGLTERDVPPGSKIMGDSATGALKVAPR